MTLDERVEPRADGHPVAVQPAPAPHRLRRGATSLGAILRAALPPLVLFAAFIGLWYLVSYVVLDPRRRFLLPPPQQVVDIGFGDGQNLSEVLNGLWATAQVALVGFAISIVLGMVLAIFMSQSKAIERSFYPYAVVLQTVPILALVPLIGFWFGFDFQSRVIVVVVFSLFPIITNTLFGLLSVSQEYHDLFTLHGAGRLSRLRRLQLPAAMPAVFTGFRISAGLSVIGAIVGDFFFRQGEPGIGRLLDLYSQRLETEQLLTAIFFSSLLGLVVFWGVGYLGHRVVGGWYDAKQR